MCAFRDTVNRWKGRFMAKIDGLDWWDFSLRKGSVGRVLANTTARIVISIIGSKSADAKLARPATTYLRTYVLYTGGGRLNFGWWVGSQQEIGWPPDSICPWRILVSLRVFLRKYILLGALLVSGTFLHMCWFTTLLCTRQSLLSLFRSRFLSVCKGRV